MLLPAAVVVVLPNDVVICQEILMKIEEREQAKNAFSRSHSRSQLARAALLPNAPQNPYITVYIRVVTIYTYIVFIITKASPAARPLAPQDKVTHSSLSSTNSHQHNS